METIENEIIKILLIDDDEDEYIITRDLFEEIGNNYHINWFNDFNKGLEEVVKSDYDICLLDYHLGAHNGIEFIEESVKKNASIPIILLTGQGDHEVDIGAMKAGATDYLDKNKLDQRVLERAIRYALERRKSEEKIRFLAYYDQLTHLPNRTLFIDRVNTTFASAKRHSRLFAIMFLDIDNFKRINDSLGHNNGDMLIKEVATRLQKSIRKEDTVSRTRPFAQLDTVARLGGDEFIILLSEIKEPENASKVAERIRNELVPPVILDDKKINVTVSMGISIYPDDGEEVETLIKNADIAMYNVKSAGKNSFQYYNNSMNSIASQKLNLESELGKALENNELRLYYQPLIEIKTKKIYGIEALIRWQHPQRGIILPADFIPIAEESGLIIKLGNFVMNTVENYYHKLKNERLAEIMFSINISPRQLSQKGFLDSVKEYLNNYNIPPDQIIFEITENNIIHNIEEANKIIESVRKLGIKIALDDFGSGYSSFVLLKRTKLDMLKIDRSFIMNIPDNSEDSIIVSSLISIGHSMNLQVIAEGVEKEEQFHFLEENKCDLVQGFYFSAPVPGEEMEDMINNR